ncbi:MAG: nicotinate (nicotinamide) nucleotide adenylyltransferase [Planctomycetes bacterium]|nr:nicotinate (nicotinamide) nucleotide adenylyltransferase [Planctomycetota bacterium]
MKIGILGGSFNPVHKGHLLIAETVRTAIGLDMVIFVPATVPPHRKIKKLASPRHRLNMLRLAIKGFPEFRVSDIELKRGGMSYTIDTIKYFKKELGARNKFYFLCGTDNIPELPFWKEFRALLKECQFVFYNRHGEHEKPLEKLAPFVDSETLKSLKKHFLDGVIINIAATDVRRRIKRKEPARQMVPEKVLKYILKNRLYA